MSYGDTKWATMFRTPQSYLRALSRKKQRNTHQVQLDQDLNKINHKILEASRFTPFYHY